MSANTTMKEEPVKALETPPSTLADPGDAPQAVFKQLGLLDKLLSPLIIATMIIGVVLGEYVPSIQPAFDTVRFDTIAIGLIVMMWPTLTKVQYELFPELFRTSRLWFHILLSLGLNWIIGPLVMLALAWATLPDLPTYRTGVILVGLARCIAMVMVWNTLARGDTEYCAVLVIVNSALQIILYSPYAVLFINIISGGAKHGGESGIRISYGTVAISVLIYLGIPLLLGVITRYTVWALAGRRFLDTKFLPYFSPLALIGLLYTILVMFAYQGHHIVHNIGSVFRVFVPMVLYFVIMWSGAFALVAYLSRRDSRRTDGHTSRKGMFGYEMAVVQAFTAGSNNFVGIHCYFIIVLYLISTLAGTSHRGLHRGVRREL
ncbi:hypothetical protein H0H92_006314 [Tricholoma furcatifolium]|nr:hypothetical protein H0H92_006314 [Tricholoma furcatifolium]